MYAIRINRNGECIAGTNPKNTIEELVDIFNDLFDWGDIDCESSIDIYEESNRIGYLQYTPSGYVAVDDEERMI